MGQPVCSSFLKISCIHILSPLKKFHVNPKYIPLMIFSFRTEVCIDI